MPILSRTHAPGAASVLALLSFAAVTPLSAQRLLISAGGGVATDTRGVRSSALTVSPTLIIAPSPTSWLSASAHGSRFAEGSSALAAGAAAGNRVALGSHATFIVAGAGSVTRASYGASFSQVEASPGVELHRGVLAGGVAARFAGATSSRPAAFAPGLPSGRNADTSRSAVGFSAAAGIRGALLDNGTLFDAGYREEHSRISGEAVVDRAVGVAAAGREALISAAVGARRSRSENGVFANATLTVGVSSPVGLQIGAGSYLANRLTSVPGGAFASAGLVMRFGSATPRTRPAPSPSGVVPPASGHTRLAIRAPGASRVEVAGDWSGWRAVPARRAPNGVWYVDLLIEPGRYRYAFKVDGSTWAVPEGVPAEDDGLGGRSAWLTVRRA